MIYYCQGGSDATITDDDLKNALFYAFDQIGPKKKVLLIPPDFTRLASQAGKITQIAWEYYQDAITDILPALGTHRAMTEHELKKMFGSIPKDRFRVHDWRNDVVTLGEVPASFIKGISENKADYSWPAQVNRLLVKEDFDLILSIGQVVPHEVIGMANFNKNIFVGTGGAEGINKSHFLGAVYGMERIMGRADTPVRQVLNYASEHFAQSLPIVYIQTVIGAAEKGHLTIKGLYIGDDKECFEKAAELSLKVNFEMVEKPLKKVVVYLDPEKYKSTWLGNKSIYRTRMAIADGGELIILAPGLGEFGEDKEIDHLIRKYGYIGTDKVLQLVHTQNDLKKNLSAAAHLIHGSSEDRFNITYCPGHLDEAEIKSVNYHYQRLDKMLKHYNPARLNDGYNRLSDGEEIYYISNPALGLWAHKDRFK